MSSKARFRIAHRLVKLGLAFSIPLLDHHYNRQVFTDFDRLIQSLDLLATHGPISRPTEPPQHRSPPT